MSNPVEVLIPKDNHKPGPDVGKMLRTYLKKKRINKASLSARINSHQSAVGRMVKRSTIQSEWLWQACHALKYNLFADLGAMLPQEYESEALEKMRAELKEVKKERDLLKGMLMGR